MQSLCIKVCFQKQTGIPKSKSLSHTVSCSPKRLDEIYRITRNPPNTGLYHIKLCGTPSYFWHPVAKVKPGIDTYATVQSCSTHGISESTTRVTSAQHPALQGGFPAPNAKPCAGSSRPTEQMRRWQAHTKAGEEKTGTNLKGQKQQQQTPVTDSG